MAQPYSFYLTDWDAPQTAFTYAEDGEGNPGALGRCYSMATVENKGDVAELKALVDKLNAASKSSFALPKSLVFGEGYKLEVAPVEVAAPVAEPKAEAKAAKVEANNYVKFTSRIRPFYM